MANFNYIERVRLHYQFIEAVKEGDSVMAFQGIFLNGILLCARSIV